VPNCFQLLRNGEAVSLNVVDEEMCRYFEAPCDPERYYAEWYLNVGWDLAMGESFVEIRAKYEDGTDLARVVDWLAANFTARSWYAPRSRSRDP
jgi:hypothetical protein